MTINLLGTVPEDDADRIEDMGENSHHLATQRIQHGSSQEVNEIQNEVLASEQDVEVPIVENFDPEEDHATEAHEEAWEQNQAAEGAHEVAWEQHQAAEQGFDEAIEEQLEAQEAQEEALEEQIEEELVRIPLPQEEEEQHLDTVDYDIAIPSQHSYLGWEIILITLLLY